jgi:hypothetical protein
VFEAPVKEDQLTTEVKPGVFSSTAIIKLPPVYVKGVENETSNQLLAVGAPTTP